MKDGKINYVKMGLSRADVVARLYNASCTGGMGVLHYDPSDMTVKDAQAEIDAVAFDLPHERVVRFDYLKGRVMKVDLTDESFSPHLYDRDNGPGAALRALKP